MDFGFSAEQEMLRETARRFLDQDCGSATVRAAAAADTAFVPALWDAIARLGWLAIPWSEEVGGIGGSFLDLAVVFEETGRALLPGPLLATLLGGLAVRDGDESLRREVLPSVASGERRLAFAVSEADGRDDADAIRLRARADGAGFRLDGEKRFVLDADAADLIVVAARTSDELHGISLFVVERLAPGVTVTPIRGIDMTRRQCAVRLDGVRVDAARRLGPLDGAWPTIAGVLQQARAALALELVGVAQRTLELSVAYAKERTQFGRPIGSFQAVKHRCVDMMVGVETARSLAYYAAWTVAEATADAPEAVAMAKAYCGTVAKTVTSDAIQVHGGIGFTWEHDLHLFHRRALAADAAFGGAVEHRDSVASSLLPRLSGG